MLLVDGLQYVNWNRDLFEKAQRSGLSAIHVTIAYWENIRETSGEHRQLEPTFYQPCRPDYADSSGCGYS